MFGWLKRKKPAGVDRNEKPPVVPPRLERIPKWCHPGKGGKRLLCPEPQCKGITHVYNFKWSALVCIHCGEANNKYDWYLAPKDHRIDARDHAFVKREAS